MKKPKKRHVLDDYSDNDNDLRMRFGKICSKKQLGNVQMKHIETYKRQKSKMFLVASDNESEEEEGGRLTKCF